MSSDQIDPATATWRKSSHSNQDGAAYGVHQAAGPVSLRR